MQYVGASFLLPNIDIVRVVLGTPAHAESYINTTKLIFFSCVKCLTIYSTVFGKPYHVQLISKRVHAYRNILHLIGKISTKNGLRELIPSCFIPVLGSPQGDPGLRCSANMNNFGLPVPVC